MRAAEINKTGGPEVIEIKDIKLDDPKSVSYTHLTLPTICSV